jgi:dTMP kinase
MHTVPMVRGKLIVFEGIDGVGKQTQVALLAKRMRAEGKTVQVFSIPRYKTPIGKLIKRALHGEFGDFRHLDPHLSSMPYFMDYALAKDEFERALREGDVIFDRYVQSTFAYHAAKISGASQQKLLRELETIAFKEIKLPRPDAIILLDVPPEVARTLMHKRKQDQNERDRDYQRKVAAIYKGMAKGKEWRVIDCAPQGSMRSRADIHKEIWSTLRPKR